MKLNITVDIDWIEDKQSVSENRRGMPCPKCNKQ